MTWAKLDDDLTFHEKIVDAGNAAVGVWARSLAWCSQHLTDGHVPNKIARLVAGESRGALRALVRSRLWVECTGGYTVVNYLKYNPSRAEVLEKREKDRRRKEGKSERPPDGTEAASEPPDPVPIPSRPDPVKDDDHDHGASQNHIDSLDELQRVGCGSPHKWRWMNGGPRGDEIRSELVKLLPISRVNFDRHAQTTDAKAARPGFGFFLACLKNDREASNRDDDDLPFPLEGVGDMMREIIRRGPDG